MFEPLHAPLLPRHRFYARLRRHGLLAIVTLVVSVAIGMIGYHGFENLGWVDAYTNAAMILSGMGPLDPIKTPGGRIFVGTYSLFSGVVFLTTVGFFLMPLLHRLLHKFHLETGKVRRDE
jgi:hypothetical protein